MKTGIKMKNQLHLVAHQPLLRFKMEISVPKTSFKLSSANPMFRLAHFSRFDRPFGYKPN